jgi:putative DNA primase/helicase
VIPDELKLRPQWVAWRLERRAGQATKVPVDAASGSCAKTNDATTWASCEAAGEARKRFGCDGIGFVFSPDDPYVGIDVDHCRDPQSGAIAAEAQAIISALGTYAEISVSGSGVHLIGRGTLPAGCRHRAHLAGFEVELYARGRYFVMTGDTLPGSPDEIRECQPQLDALLSHLFAWQDAEPARPAQHEPLARKPDDEVLLQRAFAARNGAKFSRLWGGDTSDYEGDESRADLALLCQLAFWCEGDREAVDRLFRRSALYRPKWERNDYRTSSIALACELYTTRSAAERTDRRSAASPRTVEEIFASLPDDAEPSVIGQALHELSRLAEGADALARQTLRETAIKALKRFSLSSPAKMVDAALTLSQPDDDPPPGALTIPEVEPWSEPVDGTQLLQAVCDTFARFIVLPDGAGEALALWVLYSYVSDAFFVSPRLALNSPVKRCGKTNTMSILATLVCRPLPVSNISAASVFRTIDKFKPTLLMDEAETFLRDNEELRGILNSGHTKPTAFVVRLVGDGFEPTQFLTFAPIVFALIGKLPDTLEDRSIAIPLRRRAPNEKVERLRVDRLSQLDPLARQAARWGADHLEALRSADPDVPALGNDRAEDNWRPLLAIADAVGGEWPRRAREALRTLVGDQAGDDSVAVQLLGDIREIFLRCGVERLSSDQLVRELAAREDRPWPEWRAGRAITPTQVARLLRGFQIKPRSVRLDASTTKKGYELAAFADGFARYLPEAGVTAVTDLQRSTSQDVTDGPLVTSTHPSICRDVTPVTAELPLWEDDL